MLNAIVDTLRGDRAKFALETEYLKETAKDDIIDERIDVAESQYFKETTEELVEAADMVKRLSDEEDLVEESAELEKILSADGDLSFKEVIGL